MIDLDELAARIAEDTGRGDAAEARHVLTATVAALGAQLDRAEAEVVAAGLPPPLAAAMRAGGADARPWSDDPFADLAARAGLHRGLAAEYAHVIGRRLADRLAPDARQLLARRLPAPWSELVRPRGAAAAPPPHHHAPPSGEGHTLATGRSGSHHAVAEHGVERAHAGSVARAANPHGEHKLSSGAPGGEPVTDAHPHPGRAISDADG